MNKIINNKNFHYSTKEIENHFSINRVSWSQFYPSERKIISELGITKTSKVLDFGCACGGLGLALKEKYNLIDYTGIEINLEAINTAQELNPHGKFINADLLEANKMGIQPNYYDFVFSLSCIDWNVEFNKMLKEAFSFVKPDGSFIISLRLSFNQTMNDINKSYQFINYNNDKKGEVAPYVVLNFNDLFFYINKLLNIAKVSGFVFWGKPSKTAVTPYQKLFFAVFSIKRNSNEYSDKIRYNLDFPDDVLKFINANVS